MEFGEIGLKRENLTVRIRREKNKLRVDSVREKLMISAFGFNPLKKAKFQSLFESLKLFLKEDSVLINDVIRGISEEVKDYDNKSGVFNADTLTLFKQVYCKLGEVRSINPPNLNYSPFKLQQKMITLIAIFPYFDIITPAVFSSHHIMDFIIYLLSNNHKLRRPLQLISQLIRTPALRDQLVKSSSLLKRLACETEYVSKNLSAQYCVDTNILLLEWWNAVEIDQYEIQTLETYQSVYLLSMHAIMNYEQYAERSNRHDDEINQYPVSNALNIIWKYLNTFKEELVNLPRFNSDVDCYFTLLDSDGVVESTDDVLKLILLMCEQCTQSRDKLLNKQENIETLVSIVSSTKYNQRIGADIMKCLIRETRTHLRYYVFLERLFLCCVENEYLSAETKQILWSFITIWFRFATDNKYLNSQDLKLLNILSKSKQPLGEAMECQLWATVMYLGPCVSIPDYIIDTHSDTLDSQLL